MKPTRWRPLVAAALLVGAPRPPAAIGAEATPEVPAIAELRGVIEGAEFGGVPVVEVSVGAAGARWPSPWGPGGAESVTIVAPGGTFGGRTLALPVLGGARRGGGSRGIFDQFADEPFLQQLELRLQRRELGGRLRQTLEDYLVRRAALVAELDRELTRDGRTPASLAALAGRQAPRLAELEERAEDLRRRLAQGGLIHGSAFDARASRSWRLDAKALTAARAANRDKEVTVALEAAYFADGLSAAQRRLLREAAAELDHVEWARLFPTDDEPAAPPRPFLFLPEQAVVEWPAGAPVEFVRELEEFLALKRALHGELRDAVYFNDTRPDAERAALFARLAETQAPRILELERRAEALRPQLDALVFDAASRPDAFSPDLRRRIAEHRVRKQAMQARFKTELAQAGRSRAEPPRVLRLHTDGRPQQGEEVIASLAVFEGREVEKLARLERTPDAALDRELGRELRRTVQPLLPGGAAGARFGFSVATGETTPAQRDAARARFDEVWLRRADLTGPLEAEARRLQGELAALDAGGTLRLVADLTAHWLRVELVARELSFELGLVRRPETPDERARRSEAAIAELTRRQQAAIAALEREEAAIREELARTSGAVSAPRADLDAVLGRIRDALRGAAEQWTSERYRAAVLTPGLSPAQRRLLLGAAIVELRRTGGTGKEATPARE